MRQLERSCEARSNGPISQHEAVSVSFSRFRRTDFMPEHTTEEPMADDDAKPVPVEPDLDATKTEPPF